MSLLGRASRRWMLTHRIETALCTFGIALGVAVVLAIDLSIQSARQAFALSVDTVTGQATHHIVGGPEGVGESEYTRLRTELGYRNLAPLVESQVALLAPMEDSFTLLGVDIFAERGLREFTGLRPDVDLARFLGEPGAVLLSSPTQARLGVQIGDRLLLRAAARRVEVTLVGNFTVDDESTRAALDGIIVADLATAQEVLGMEGRLSRIEARFDRDEAGRRAASELGALLPPDYRVTAAGETGARLSGLLVAFEKNLTFLSLLALVVGAFLIHQTITFAVVRRRDLFGRLRSLGVTRRELLLRVLGEALVLGWLGVGLGIAIGVGLARGLLSGVAATINDLYFRLRVTELAIPLSSLLKATALGLVTVLVGAAFPAREAARRDVRLATQASVVESRTRAQLMARCWFGLALLALGGIAIAVPSRDLLPCYLSLLGLVGGAAALAPTLTHGLAVGLRTLLGRWLGASGRLAAAGVVSGLSRTGLAVGALAMALAMALGVGLMIRSFRGAVVDWLGQTLQGDLYLSPASTSARLSPQEYLKPALLAELANLEDVSSLTLNRTVTLELETGPTMVVALGLGADDPARFDLIEGDEAAAVEAFRSGQGILVSEPWAFRHGRTRGDRLRLTGAGGENGARILGVFRDFTSDQGYVAVPSSLYRDLTQDERVTACALFLVDDSRAELVRAAVRTLVEKHGQDVIINTGGGVKEVSLEVFDRTFRITEILRLLSALVAFAGIVSALCALEIERARERAILRAAGLTRSGLFALTLTQSALLGLTAALIALPLGVAFAAILTGPINRRSFGWSLDFRLAAWPLLETTLLAISAALLAALWPAQRMAKAHPGPFLRGD